MFKVQSSSPLPSAIRSSSQRVPAPVYASTRARATKPAPLCPVLEAGGDTPHQQQTQRTVLDWFRVEYDIEKPGNKLPALTELDANTWVSEVKRIRGKKQPLSSAGLHALRDEYTRTIEHARALAAEPLDLDTGSCPMPSFPSDA